MSAEALCCPFCGSHDTSIVEGDTFRWRCVACNACGAMGPDVRIQTAGSGTPDEWASRAEADAIAEWNRRQHQGDSEQTTLWLGAFRYYCGRMSYAVSDFTAMLVFAWPMLNPTLRNLIAAELEAEFRRDDEMRNKGASYLPLGQQCDREAWERVRALWEVAAGSTATQETA